ncbi:MAG: hypothetical protein HN802_04455 [Candidatus Jacksonbacteria bacterium]|nr:hypothetical protein [Candidatus Jacksonbacteria bacterium]
MVIKPNVSISKPCPKYEIPLFPESIAEKRYTTGNAQATSAIPLRGRTTSPLFNFEIKNKKKATKILTKIRRDFVNEKGTDKEGMKKIGRRNITPMMKYNAIFSNRGVLSLSSTFNVAYSIKNILVITPIYNIFILTI